jgi:hypothetical protein
VSTSPACCLVNRGRDNVREMLVEDKTKIYSSFYHRKRLHNKEE